MKLRPLNDWLPTMIIVIVVVLLASAIIYNSDRNQREVIETVRQTMRERDAHAEVLFKANGQLDVRD